ncbi:MAG: hypothetical protein RLZZ31_1350 [Actinomycetota bacterium]
MKILKIVVPIVVALLLGVGVFTFGKAKTADKSEAGDQPVVQYVGGVLGFRNLLVGVSVSETTRIANSATQEDKAKAEFGSFYLVVKDKLKAANATTLNDGYTEISMDGVLTSPSLAEKLGIPYREYLMNRKELIRSETHQNDWGYCHPEFRFTVNNRPDVSKAMIFDYFSNDESNLRLFMRDLNSERGYVFQFTSFDFKNGDFTVQIFKSDPSKFQKLSSDDKVGFGRWLFNGALADGTAIDDTVHAFHVLEGTSDDPDCALDPSFS